ncbi:MAG: oligosaccharide flippase family protein [Blastocatellia bacterium]|nr:oligosaccharide flippase family protein [Blastocatellia bacterium]
MALALVVGLWLTPFFLRHLGQEDYGVWLMIGQAMTYLGLMDLGVVALLPRETAFAVGRAGSIEGAIDIPEIVGRTIRLVLWQLPFVAVVAATAWFFFPAQMRGAAGPLAWLIALFVVRFPLRIFQEVLVGLQDLAFIGKIQLIGFILTTASTVSLVIAGWGLYALVVGWGIGQFVPTIVSVWRLRWRFPCVAVIASTIAVEVGEGTACKRGMGQRRPTGAPLCLRIGRPHSRLSSRSGRGGSLRLYGKARQCPAASAAAHHGNRAAGAERASGQSRA